MERDSVYTGIFKCTDRDWHIDIIPISIEFLLRNADGHSFFIVINDRIHPVYHPILHTK